MDRKIFLSKELNENTTIVQVISAEKETNIICWGTLIIGILVKVER